MRPPSSIFVFFLSMTSVLLLVCIFAPKEAAAVTCSATELAPCLGPISGGPVTNACCSKLREQQPCLCQYIKNPLLSGYVNSANAKKVASACGVSYPSC